MTDTRQALTDNQLEPMLDAWFETDGTFYERMRAALSAQPVASAPSTPPPSAQGEPVAGILVTQADVDEARRLILEATATDLLSGDRRVVKSDRAAVYGWLCKAANYLLGEVPAAPSAQGEPVAWCLGNPKFAHSSNIIAAHEFTPDAEHADEWVALYASAPSTPPHAVVEAVPLSFDQLQSVMSQHFGGRELTDDEADSAEAFARAIERAHGIAQGSAAGRRGEMMDIEKLARLTNGLTIDFC